VALFHKNNLADYGSKMAECQIPATKKIAKATDMLRALKIPHVGLPLREAPMGERGA